MFCALAILVSLVSLFLSLRWVPEPEKFKLWSILDPLLPWSGATGLLVVACVWKSASKTNFTLMLLTAFAAIFAVGIPLFGMISGINYPARMAGAQESLAIRVPMDGPVVVAWGGDDVEKNYHAAYPDQRWAYDLVVAPHSNGSTKLEDYGCYGQEVIAPMNGIISTAQDGEADLKPGEEYFGDNVYGNYVVMKSTDDTDTRLVIAHLRRGTVSVERDQRVSQGDVLGECGNSGSSTEPHVHIHYLKIFEDGGDTFLIGQPLFFRDHSGARMPIGGFKNIDGNEVAAGDVIEHQRETAIPAE